MTLNAPCLGPGPKYLIWLSSIQIYSAFRKIDEEILGAVWMYSALVKKKKGCERRGEERRGAAADSLQALLKWEKILSAKNWCFNFVPFICRKRADHHIGNCVKLGERVEESQSHDKMCLSYHSQLVAATGSSDGYLRSIHQLRGAVDANRAFTYDTFSEEHLAIKKIFFLFGSIVSDSTNQGWNKLAFSLTLAEMMLNLSTITLNLARSRLTKTVGGIQARRKVRHL